MNGLLRKIVLVGEPMDHNAIGKRTPPGLDPHCLRWYPTNTITFNIATGETSQVITSRHFSSLLLLLSIERQIQYTYTCPTTQHFPSFLFSSLLTLTSITIERQKQYKYINKAIQKVQSSTYILDTLKPRLYKKFPYFRHTS